MLTEFLEEIEILVTPEVKVWDEKLEQYRVTRQAEYRTQTILKTRPPTESQSRLDMVIKLGKPQVVIDKFIAGVELGIAWDWCEDYIQYLNSVFDWDKWVAVQEFDSEGEPLPLATKPDAPIEPVKPIALTLLEFKAVNSKLFTSYNKQQGVEINGNAVSLNKDNSDGLVSIKTGYDLVGNAMFPTNFVADNGRGTVSITFADYAEFTHFALQFLQARGEFFK
jgi:hypothetical protein